jgi:hypothetical protein
MNTNNGGVPASYDVFFPANHPNHCTVGAVCPEAVAEHRGKFVITFGHSGFNSPTNNRGGYKTRAAALGAVRFYTNAGIKARAGRQA